jgi:MYXO-CTERM domain-containing protein
MARRGRSWALAVLVAIAPIGLLTVRADAFPEGSAFTNCISCHAAPPSGSPSTMVSIMAPATVNAGGTYAIYVHVTNALYHRYGFSMHASAGTWYATSPSGSATTTVIGGDATHSCFAAPCASDGCTASFYAVWTAPTTSASTVTFSAFGLAHDGNTTMCPGDRLGTGSTGDVTGRAADHVSAIVCGGGTHRCGDECVYDDHVDHCGVECTPCVAPTGGSARCEGPPFVCTMKCPLDAHECGGLCVPDSPEACGASCAVCPVPEHATATCIVGACGYTCEAGFVACGGRCITGTCAGFDTGVDAADARDAAPGPIDTALPPEDTSPFPTPDTGADAGAAADDESSGCGCRTSDRSRRGSAVATIVVAAMLAARRRRYRRMSM